MIALQHLLCNISAGRSCASYTQQNALLFIVECDAEVKHRHFCAACLQATVDQSFASSPDQQNNQAEQEAAAMAEETRVSVDQVLQATERQEEQKAEEPLPVGYVSRRTTDPYMQKKLRGIQV